MQYTRILDFVALARQAVAHCQTLASFTDEPGGTTRTYLSPGTRSCQEYLSAWMRKLGMRIEVDAVGNLRGLYAATSANAKRLIIASHIDTVPNAGAYDGVLGVVMALVLVECLGGERLPFAIEAIAFSEEEGVRFGFPFIGSRALVGALDDKLLDVTDRAGISVRQAIAAFGLDLSQLPQAAIQGEAGAYLEFHIEQGPVLESLDLPLGVVGGIVGQSRATITFIGRANHAGTTPMALRQDALCAAAEWIAQVEMEARTNAGLVATVGRIEARPDAVNVIPGEVTATLDLRHISDDVRQASFDRLLQAGASIAKSRRIIVEYKKLVDQAAVPMDAELTRWAEEAIASTGVTPHRMTSGAGHDAMVLAPRLPSAMIFLRSPGGISHHPEETVREGDVAAALSAGVELIHKLRSCSYLT